ncbi:2-amino-4-hydroxy-6-hydroxymethyldihydropteridine diphosphokinase [Litorivivens lipolytica]|uniref:2-amino-4-hydroxy-6-hydroxymethyldihydropteridine pyrophosphokinase n=1 Tax=Litorivivens lipolytica TaxID=1524264 RepID=A0A7W4Z4K9_9GAMM|nr:2-amino-4-hydroxy-6-hydroxymethyldihydropteridine diphosphokinase [Litorivivens lipolytica]MBB3046609.1 2-amino-4-hydroxy-6-hydroxymethyldihydropteridine diphosphokinase [Litorivivens lipolytica]
MHTCHIGLGSNLDEPLHQLKRALAALGDHPSIEVRKVSSFYGSKAVGPGEQPDFVNAVVELATSLEPIPLLHTLQSIEQQHGRVRTIRWGARTLDLDILLYDQLELDSAELTIPHPRLQDRPFVVVPLEEIAPDLALPDGTCVASLLDYASRNDVWRLPLRDGV